jgi:hypothetical protein
MRRTMMAGPLLVALLLGGCSQPEPPRVATAGSGAPTTPPAGGVASATPPTPSEQEKGILFARCMTEHGVEVPDPVDGGAPVIRLDSGGFVILGGVPEGLPEHKAWRTCRHLYPTTTYQRLEPKAAKEYRAYARCMRGRGITEGLSEVDDSGRLATRNDAATRVGDDPGPTPEFMAAHRVCRSHLSGGEGDPPPSDDPLR